MELVDAVDDADRIIGQVLRSEAPRLGANVRVIHVYLFDRRGRLLIHELSGKKRFAGSWSASVAGGVRSGESPFEAAVRELREELGIRTRRLRFRGKVRVRDDGTVKFVSIFSIVHDGPISPSTDEIAQVEWASIEAVRGWIRDGSRRFTPTFHAAFSQLEWGLIA